MLAEHVLLCAAQLGFGVLLVVVVATAVLVLVDVDVVVTVAPVFTEVDEVVDVVSLLSLVGDGVGPLLGVRVGTLLGVAVGKDAIGDEVPQPVPTLISTSAQFQNCSGAPRPSGGILVHAPTAPPG